jgi:GntR family transcriptional regulator
LIQREDDMTLTTGTPIRLDAAIGGPLHVQFRSAILDRISRGEWPEGARIDSERELCDTYGISRTTARRVIGDLVHEGILAAQVGRGTFVTGKRVQQELQALTGFSEDMRRRGMVLQTKLISFVTIPGDETAVAELDLEEAADVHIIKRLRIADTKPVAIQTAIIPAAIAPGLEAFDLSKLSLFRVLRQNFGLELATGLTRLSAGLANAAERDLLMLPRHAAVLRSIQLTKLPNGVPVELCRSSFKGEDFELTTTA